MCGTSGIYDRSGRPIERDVLERMNLAPVHRGPDGSGMLLDGEVGLGHRRLSIIDVEGGTQPIGNEDGRLQVVFNGEIYNFVAGTGALAGRSGTVPSASHVGARRMKPLQPSVGRARSGAR